jgi:hypothetical protein
MNRRHFLQIMGLSSLSLGQIGRVLAHMAGPAHHHWAWSRVSQEESRDDWRRRFAELRAAGIGSVLLGGATAEACRLAAEEGLHVHAWTWTLCRGGAELKEKHPEWYVVSREGKSACDHPPYVGYYNFLCPSRPEVREYLSGDFARIAATEGLVGAHLDYVRFPDVILPRALWEKYDLVQNEELPPFDFCYCEVCREAFIAQTGIDPLELPHPPSNEEWRRFRWDAVSRLVGEVVAAIHGQGKQATAAVFPSPAIARKLVRQDWAGWPLDAVLPMVYHSFYNEGVPWIEATVREGVQALAGKRPLYAGLYLPELKDEGQFEGAVAAAMAGGARGVALFGGVRKITD